MGIGKCRKCGSGEIKILNPGEAVMDYQCPRCGHKGSFLITEDWSPKDAGHQKG